MEGEKKGKRKNTQEGGKNQKALINDVQLSTSLSVINYVGKGKRRENPGEEGEEEKKRRIAAGHRPTIPLRISTTAIFSLSKRGGKKKGGQRRKKEEFKCADGLFNLLCLLNAAFPSRHRRKGSGAKKRKKNDHRWEPKTTSPPV